MKQFDIFGNDITEQVIQEEKKHKYSERAKKAAETRKRHKAEKESLFDKMFTIARSECDLFGNKYTNEERKEAEKYIMENLKKINDPLPSIK